MKSQIEIAVISAEKYGDMARQAVNEILTVARIGYSGDGGWKAKHYESAANILIKAEYDLLTFNPVIKAEENPIMD